MKENNNEDFRFLAHFSYENGAEYPPLLCKIFLPKRVGERPRLLFFPKDSVDNYIGARPAEMRGTVGEGASTIIIMASGVWFPSATQRHWGAAGDDRIVVGDAELLTITRPRPNSGEPSRAIFYIINSSLLRPFHTRRLNLDGSVTVERGDCLEVELNSETRLIFDLEYKLKQNDGEVTTWADLVAKIEIDTALSDLSKKSLISEMDDFLLIQSLIEGQRCACLEINWEIGTEVIFEYRMNRVAPEKSENSRRNCLISDRDAKEFLQLAYKNLKAYPEHGLLKSSLQAMTLFEDETIGVKFMRFFSAFEGLVLAFRRMQNLEFSINKLADRQSIENSIKATLKSHDLLTNEKQLRSLLYENIAGLFRVSLRQASERFFELHNIVLADTWPLFDTSDGVSLAQIRNKIAHGENFSTEEWWNISEALKSLGIILDRSILAVLGWDYQKSRSHLMHECDPKLTSARISLSQAISDRDLRQG